MRVCSTPRPWPKTLALRVRVSAGLALAVLALGWLAPEKAAAQAGSADSRDPAVAPAAPADDERAAFHAQSTFVMQGHDAFDSPYRGANSLNPTANARETWDVTLYGGVRLWRGGELWIDGEVDQGFGLSDTLGVAGFPSGEAYKVGAATPYFRVQRIFVRQTIDLGGDEEAVAGDLNQLGGHRTADHVTITVGKFAVSDIFDTNKYAHDPRNDFLNWTIIDAGTFDYAADSWGYSAGGAVEWAQGAWTGRLGAFLLSDVPNSPDLDVRFKQFQLVGELERRFELAGHSGAARVTAFVSRGRMARLDDAVAAAAGTGAPPDVADVRRYASRPGFSVNLEQQVTSDLGVFARAGWADGRFEAYEFTDVDRSLSGGASLNGARWSRKDDAIGVGGAVNEASRSREAYLDAGGLGILVGDGRLPHPGSEKIVETYYRAQINAHLQLSADYQHIWDPAFNRDRGPVDVVALRGHVQF